ncbi:hypothetical protein [Blastococcus sp. TBT05-19]|uniref:hypothetical protein n=1 Tax=Blastococcus sp. TBT05-19 TaxID=2250581 RepID=UPI0018F322B5|nr:hypothetical protein [Blastococcus sp. TBT05-19]
MSIGIVAALAPSMAQAADGCGFVVCTEVKHSPGAITAAHVEQSDGGQYFASNVAPPAPPYRYQLSPPCVVDDRENGGCRPSDFRTCPSPPGRIVEDLVLERQNLVLPDSPTTIDGLTPLAGAAPGTPVGGWDQMLRACIDITALNPPPSPGEVFRYFETLPLPQLLTQHQPPGNGLSGLPVIFYTDSSTTQTFTVDIRGFTVVIEAAAQQFTWHTGDATGQIVTTDPGLPYPDQTIEHDYRSGTYTAYLTVTWGATFTVNGSAPADVPGTTTTDGPPVTFDVLQARSVLTNPYD